MAGSNSPDDTSLNDPSDSVDRDNQNDAAQATPTESAAAPATADISTREESLVPAPTAQQVDGLQVDGLQAELDSATEPYVGLWNRLVSTTNWEKGKIILQWRDALKQTGVPPTEYADEAWSRRVGGVTGQHVGRLRRVFGRFGTNHDDFSGLYWSHFFAAVEWDDAEMWLEGAPQSKWSVSQMRRQRWESMGRPGEAPQEADVVSGERDEDFEPALSEQPTDGDLAVGLRPDGPDFGDESDVADGSMMPGIVAEASTGDTPEGPQPFLELPDLPDDLADAFDSFKIAVLNHKNDGWQAVSQQAVLATLESLKQLVLGEEAAEQEVS